MGGAAFGMPGLALDDPGSASRLAVAGSRAVAVLLAVAGAGVVAFGAVDLGALPTFTTAHATWVFVVDITTGLVLLLQFWANHRLVYAVLASAYLTDALLMPAFMLSFPGALRPGESVIGGDQTSIWIWHAWHLVFPTTVVAALLARRRRVEDERVLRVLVLAVVAAVVLAGVASGVATMLEEHLPALIHPASEHPLTGAFYPLAYGLVVLTGVVTVLLWRRGTRERSALHLWLAVTLTAFVLDTLANAFATHRFTVGWYFGRVASVVASTVLLLVFLTEVGRLHRRLVVAASALSAVNEGLVTAVHEREELVVDLRRSEEQVRQLAFYDDLTGLPNRRLLADRAEQAMAQRIRHGGSVAVLFVDLDGFKEINDRLGHDVGDAVLKEVAGRLRASSRTEDTVSRVGGDEFVLLLAEVARPGDAGLVAEKCLASLVRPVLTAGQLVEVTCSIGIALHPQDERADFPALLKDADIAMYAAKAAGRNLYRYYGDLPLAVHRHVPS